MWLYIMPPNAHSYRLYSSILLSDEVACRCYGSRGEASGSIRDANRTEREPSFYKLDKNPNRTQTMRDLFHLYHFAIMSPLPKWFVFLGSRHLSNNYCYCYCPKNSVHAGFYLYLLSWPAILEGTQVTAAKKWQMLPDSYCQYQQQAQPVKEFFLCVGLFSQRDDAAWLLLT